MGRAGGRLMFTLSGFIVWALFVCYVIIALGCIDWEE